VREIHMPQIALGTDEVIVRQWLVSPDAAFAEGDPLLEIETDKATMDVEAPFAGVLVDQAYAEGDTVAVGAVIGHAVEPGGDADAARAALPTTPRAPEPEPVPAVAVAVAAPAAPAAARRFIDVEDGELAGLGLPRRTPPPAEDPGPAGPFARRALTRRRLAIGRRMSAATAVPTFVVQREVPATAALAAVKAARAAGHTATVTDLLVQAVAAAAGAHPRTNAWVLDGEAMEFEHVGVALAVDTPDGVVAPVIREAGSLGLHEIAARRADLVTRARAQALDARELTGATITLSNVAGLGSHAIVPVLTVPQAVAIGTGTARDGLLTVTFVGDHRVVDGADGARFLATFAAALDDPAT
jgi:pyruvate/2-oxoglutarate dehydrogenase complex dihydrolipoamide acyltransferase (E2) component